MSIQYALLGLLSWQPFSGYDLKKIISESDLFYWSGNNNQIYNSLVQLHKDGLVSQQIEYQDTLPPRKVYSITEQGQEELRKWVLSNPELPELRNTFLIQLAWAESLSDEEIDHLLSQYEEEIEVQIRMQQERDRRPGPAQTPNRSPREAYLWSKIAENMAATYQKELEWVRQVREDLREEKYTGRR